MPRIVSALEKNKAVEMMLKKNEKGEPVWGQRDIAKETGLSRPYIRKLAKEINFQFPRNGIEVIGQECVCENCGKVFRRPPSKIERAKRPFHNEECKRTYFKKHKMGNGFVPNDLQTT